MIWGFDRDLMRDYELDADFFTWLRNSSFKHCYTKSTILLAHAAWAAGRGAK